MANIEIGVDEYRNLLSDSIRLCNTQKYILGAIRNRSGHYVSTDVRDMVINLGITEEAKEANEEAEAMQAEKKKAEEISKFQNAIKEQEADNG